MTCWLAFVFLGDGHGHALVSVDPILDVSGGNCSGARRWHPMLSPTVIMATARKHLDDPSDTDASSIATRLYNHEHPFQSVAIYSPCLHLLFPSSQLSALHVAAPCTLLTVHAIPESQAQPGIALT